MSHSQSIRIRDVVRVIRLVYEACEFGDDAIAWRRHFIEGLRKIVGKDVRGIAGVLGQPVNPLAVNTPLMFWVGLDGPQTAIWDRYLEGGDVTPDPVTPRMIACGPRDFTILREQLCNDGEWYNSNYFNEIRRPMGIDDLLFTQIMPTGLCYSTNFALCRPIDSRPFDRRDVAIIHLSQIELRKIWRNGAGALHQLGERQRQVLELLCDGYSEKEAAHRLSLSSHTVHNYVTLLHRKLNAHSRAELVRAGLKMLRNKGPRVLPRPVQ